MILNFIHLKGSKVSKHCLRVRTAVQDVPRAGGHPDGEEEAAEDQDHLHLRPAEGAGESVPGDPLPRHLHQGGDRHED